MIRSFLTVSTGTLASRLLGFVRDSMIAALLGTGPIADAFLLAFQLINVVRRLLTEGALNAALIPAWLRLRQDKGETAAGAFAGKVLATISTALIGTTALLGLLMPFVLIVLAPGFAGKQTLQLAVEDARLMLPYLAFAGPSAVMLALFSAQSRFALTAFSPLLFNLTLIAAMIVLILSGETAAFVAPALAATIGIAGLLQLLILASRRSDRIAMPLRVSVDAEMRGFLARAVPGMIANSTPQLLMVGGAIIASSSPSAVSWLYFANRLIELPLGIVSVAMGTVLVGELTRSLQDGEAAASAQAHALELAAGLALPASLGLIALGEPIVRLLFEHGAFSAQDTSATAQALIWLALALPANVLSKALSPSFFAREDTATPLKAGVIGFVVAIIAAFILSHLFGFGASGVAAGIALGAWSSAASLTRSVAAAFGFSLPAATQQRLAKITAAAFIMAGLLWLTTRLTGQSVPGHGLAQALSVLLTIAGGLAIYLFLLALFGVAGWRTAVEAIRTRKPRDLRS